MSVDSISEKNDGEVSSTATTNNDQSRNKENVPQAASTLALPENSNEPDGQSPVATARSENAEQNGEETTTTSEAIIRRRHKKFNRQFYYIGGNNGTQIVDEYLNSLGWDRITDRNREDYKLKWCEIKSHNNYCSFREGEQLCYQIPNNKVLTTKIGLLTSLQEYDRVMNKVKKGKPRIMKYQDFFPETYRMDIKEERENFCELYQEGEIWISKPTGLNQGKGIYLIRTKEDIAKFQVKMADIEEEVQNTRKLPFKVPMARIAQRYITNPLLLDGKKFDVRNYMLIASSQPFVVFYRDGYCRLTCSPYDEHSTDLTSHLTNQFMQKKNPLYQEVKDETVWSMDRFNEYVNHNFMAKKDLPQDWVHTVLRRRCQQIMLHCFQSVRHKLECKLGFFDLYGCDFLVDDNFKVHLLEFNCNPALHTNCELLKEVIPSVVTETLQLSLEIFNKVKAKERIMPLASQNQVVLLYNGDLIEAEERREKLRTIAEQRKRARSAQRRKKFMANFNLQRYAYQGQRNSDGENDVNATTVTTSSTSPTLSNPTTSNGPVVLSATGQNVTNRLYPKAPPSTEVSPNSSAPVAVTGSRSQTSLSTTSTTHSPTRVTASKSMPNIVSKKPFYAGGTVPSRPYSAPRFHRGKKVEPRPALNSVSTNKNGTNSSHTNSVREEEAVTEKSIAASLDAKLKEYKPIEPTSFKNPVRTKTDKEIKTEKKITEPERKETEPKQQTRGRPRERIKHIRSKSQEEDLSQSMECGSPSENEKNEKILEANRKLLEAMTSSAIQAPAAKLPPSYHSKVNLDTEFSKKYLAGVAVSRKGQNVMGKINGMIRSYKTPQPSATTMDSKDAQGTIQSSSEPFLQHQKLQYRAPTAVRVRQTLQATTCTLEIGPKARRGLVAIPNPAQSSSPVNQIYKSNHPNNSNITRLRMMNAAAATFPFPVGIDIDDTTLSPSMKVGLNDPSVNLQSAVSIHQFDEVNMAEAKTRANCVDSSTQTPISNYTLSSEEKVIWRLRTKVGATGSNARMSRPPVPSNEVIMKTSMPSSFTGIKTYQGITQHSPRYIAVRPSLANGVTMVISPPPLVSGKNMLPTIREGKNGTSDSPGDSSSLYCEHALTPQLSQISQTPNSDGEEDAPSGAAIKTILSEVTQSKLEDNSEKWMAPG